MKKPIDFCTKLLPNDLENFSSFIKAHAAGWYRTFPWRDTYDPYHILVSEIMLQQTQVSRAVDKYLNFIEQFPSIGSLAHSSLRTVLTAWVGLGYNRRAIALHKTAQLIMLHHGGKVPQTTQMLDELPGIGINTAGSIAAFAYNQPTVFIETNIRTVFLHHFFQSVEQVDDDALIPLVKQTVCHTDPRRWYYALMDYGTILKASFPNPNKRSRHYSKQSAFVGSDRRIRGFIVRLLTHTAQATDEELFAALDKAWAQPDRVQYNRVIERLCQEHIITYEQPFYSISHSQSCNTLQAL